MGSLDFSWQDKISKLATASSPELVATDLFNLVKLKEICIHRIAPMLFRTDQSMLSDRIHSVIAQKEQQGTLTQPLKQWALAAADSNKLETFLEESFAISRSRPELKKFAALSDDKQYQILTFFRDRTLTNQVIIGAKTAFKTSSLYFLSFLNLLYYGTFPSGDLEKKASSIVQEFAFTNLLQRVTVAGFQEACECLFYRMPISLFANETLKHNQFRASAEQVELGSASLNSLLHQIVSPIKKLDFLWMQDLYIGLLSKIKNPGYTYERCSAYFMYGKDSGAWCSHALDLRPLRKYSNIFFERVQDGRERVSRDLLYHKYGFVASWTHRVISGLLSTMPPDPIEYVRL